MKRKTTHGRPPVYCSIGCRRAAEYQERRKTRGFEGLKKGFQELGEAETRRKLADDPEFAVQLIELTETYLKPPDGRTRVEDDWNVIHLFFRDQKQSFQVIGHDNPLPSSADIDEAEVTGNWRPMVEAALAGMAWQLANGFIPDLRGFDGAH